MERDLKRLTSRLSADMRDAAQPMFDAMLDLSDADASDADLDLLVKQFQNAIDDASKAADSMFADGAAAMRVRLVDLKASDRTLAKADAMIERNADRLSDRADKIESRFEERLADLFPEYAGMSDLPDDSEGDDGSSGQSGGSGEDA